MRRSRSAARPDHRIDTSAGDGARTLLRDDQLPQIGIERSDDTLDWGSLGALSLVGRFRG